MKVRIHTHTVPRFCHDGLIVTEAWLEIDWERAEPKVRAAVEKFHGRFLRTHPMDVDKWAGVGLAIVDGKLVRLATPPADLGEPAVAGDPDVEPEPVRPARQPRAPRAAAVR